MRALWIDFVLVEDPGPPCRRGVHPVARVVWCPVLVPVVADFGPAVVRVVADFGPDMSGVFPDFSTLRAGRDMGSPGVSKREG